VSAATPAKVAPSGRMHAPTQEDLRALLAQHAGNIASVARELHRDRAQIHRWIRRYAIDPDEFRGDSSMR
jgi:transcriptional regulator of acetoin/glycerol metabolism